MTQARQLGFSATVRASAVMVVVLFVVKGFEVVSHTSLSGFGITPRTQAGLIGILFSPLLHANWGHLLANSLPLFVLLILLLGNRHYYPYRTLGLIWLASGLGTWLIGRSHNAGGAPIVHIGASSIIFGLAAYLIVSGFLMKSLQSVIVAVLVFVFFGGIFYGVIPHAGPISWEGHLCGAIAGVWAARNNHSGR